MSRIKNNAQAPKEEMVTENNQSTEQTKISGSLMTRRKIRAAIGGAVALILTGCPPKYKDFEMTEDAGVPADQRVSAPDSAPNKPSGAEQYLGIWEPVSKEDKNKWNINKLNPDEPQPSATAKLKDGTEVKLLMPIRSPLEVHISGYRVGLFSLKRISRRTTDLLIGGIYDGNGQHFIILWWSRIKKNMVFRIQRKDDHLHIYICEQSLNRARCVDKGKPKWHTYKKVSL